MFERLKTPEEAFNYKLGATLKMERTVLEMLEDNVEKAHETKLKQLLRHHHDETARHVKNVERAFGVLGWDIDDSPCPAIEGLEKEAKANIKKADESLVDAVILQGAVETEHHEIGVYENLIINARALGRQDVADLLQQNLNDEQHTLEEVRSLEESMSVAFQRTS